MGWQVRAARFLQEATAYLREMCADGEDVVAYVFSHSVVPNLRVPLTPHRLAGMPSEFIPCHEVSLSETVEKRRPARCACRGICPFNIED